MSAKLNQIRDQALAIVFTEFEEEKLCKSVKSFEESDVTDDDIQCVKDKYRNAFKNYFTTAFDIAFQKDLVAKLKENSTSESDQSVEIIEDELNLSVTDEDLQNLDNANTLVTRYRKIKPPRCTLLLEKTLKLQVESLHKIKTNVHGVKPIDPEEAVVVSDKSSLELNQEYSKLRGDIKNELEKLRRFETAAQILVGNQKQETTRSTNHVVQETHDAKDNSIQA